MTLPLPPHIVIVEMKMSTIFIHPSFTTFSTHVCETLTVQVIRLKIRVFILELVGTSTLSLEYHKRSLPWNSLASIHAWVTLPLLSVAAQSTVWQVWKCQWTMSSASFLWSERSRVGLPMLSFKLLQVDFYHQSGSGISALHCSHSNLRIEEEKKKRKKIGD